MGFYPVVAPLPNNKNDIRIFVQDNGFIFIRFVVKKYEFNWTFTNKDTGAVIKTFTNVDEGEFSVTEAVPNCKVTCKVFAYIDSWKEWKTSFDYNGKHYTLGSNSKIDLVNWAVPVASTHFTMTSQDPNTNNLIGYNGQAYNFGGGNGMFIGKTGLQAKFGDYCFMINPQEIQNVTLAGSEIFGKGIWSINKYTFTKQQGPYVDSETAVSEFLTQGRGFGAKNVRAAGTTGKLTVLPEDDIIMVTDFVGVSGTTGRIEVEICFPPCTDTTFMGHEVSIMHIHKPYGEWSSSCIVSSTDS